MNEEIRISACIGVGANLLAYKIAINCITASEQFWLFSRLNFCVVRGRTLSFVSTYVFQISIQSAPISFEAAVLSTNPFDLFGEFFGDCVRHFCFSATMISEDKIECKVRRGSQVSSSEP